MIRIARPIRLFVPLAVVFCLAFTATAQFDVLTQHNDNARTGANTKETKLNTASVNKTTFGKLCFREVDGNPYAQPLYATQVDIASLGKRNVVILATEGNSVYAFDADNTTQGDPKATLWHKGPEVFGAPIPTKELLDDLNKGPGNTVRCGDLTTQVGITSTPVISPDKTTIYVVAKSWDKATRKYFQKLHALKMSDGSAAMAPVAIEGEVNGAGRGSVGGKIKFQPLYQLNRPALLLQDGKIYIAYGGHCDRGPYHGWVFAYDAATLTKIDIYNTTPDGNEDPNQGEGGIWQSGQGPASDSASNIYISIGDGTYQEAAGKLKDCADSVVKLRVNSGKFEVVDWFTPFNQKELDNDDVDLGSMGALLIPDSNLLVAGGKEGKFYLIDRDHMGHKGTSNDNQIVQSFQVTKNKEHNPASGHLDWYNLHSAPVYYDGPKGRLVYVCGEEDFVKAYRLVTTAGTTKFADPKPFLKSNIRAPFRQGADLSRSVFMPGGMLALSANGTAPGSGILWVAMPFDNSANQTIVPGILRAFDAADLTREIWNSRQNLNRDNLGMYPKFCPPTVADGKVFLPAFNAEKMVGGEHVIDDAPGKDRAALVIYGLIPH